SRAGRVAQGHIPQRVGPALRPVRSVLVLHRLVHARARPRSRRATPRDRRRARASQRVTTTILVVDDEATLRETLAWNLEQEGYRVVQAADGRAALERFRGEQPDLVLLDLMLP